MMPRIRITELLHEVAQETGFLAAFTNLRTGERCPNENALLATILADATNLGLSRMAAASQGVTRDQLRSEEHTSELQSLMRISYAVFCLKKKKIRKITHERITCKKKKTERKKQEKNQQRPNYNHTNPTT